MNLKDLTQQTTFWQGERFEFPTSYVLRSWGGVKFFDIGANYGFYSYLMLSSFPKLLAYAFEPNKNTFALMQQTKKGNNFERLQIFNVGIGSQPGHLDLHPGIEDSGHSTFLPHPEFIGQSLGKVRILSFDQWLREKSLDLPKETEWVAKIDVEGYELNVLKGMRESLLARAFKGISMEILEHTLALAGHKPEDIFNFMNTVGYKPIDKADLLRRYRRINTANIFFEPI